MPASSGCTSNTARSIIVLNTALTSYQQSAKRSFQTNTGHYLVRFKQRTLLYLGKDIIISNYWFIFQIFVHTVPLTNDNEVARAYRTGCTDCAKVKRVFDKGIANDDNFYDGKFICCGDDLCRAIIPSTYDESDRDVDEGLVLNIDNDSADDINSDSANAQSFTADINRSKWTNQTVDEIDNSSNISTSSWLTIVVLVIASSC